MTSVHRTSKPKLFGLSILLLAFCVAVFYLPSITAYVNEAYHHQVEFLTGNMAKPTSHYLSF